MPFQKRCFIFRNVDGIHRTKSAPLAVFSTEIYPFSIALNAQCMCACGCVSVNVCVCVGARQREYNKSVTMNLLDSESDSNLSFISPAGVSENASGWI